MVTKLLISSCLLLILFLSYFDSYGIDGIVPLIQEHFNIEDAQTAVIRTSSSIVHSVSLGLIWILGDVFERRKFMIVSVTAWILLSLISIWLGSKTYLMFVVFRSLGAAASSVFGVLVPVMLADLFEDRALGVALMCMTACEALSGMFSDIMGSIIVSSGIPWQTDLLIGPLLTIFPLLGLLCSRNTSRRIERMDKTPIISRIFSSAFGLFSIKSFVLMTVIISMEMFYGRSSMFWFPSYVLSAFTSFPESFYGLSYTSVTTLKSVATLTGTFNGLPFFLWFAQSWRHGTGPFSGRAGNPRAYPIVVCVGSFILAGANVLDVVLLPKNYVACLAAIFIAGFGSAATISLRQLMMLVVVPNSSRAAAVALSRLISGIVSTPSAQLFGMLSDAIRGDSTLPYDRFHAYQLALLIFSSIMIVAAFFYLVLVAFFPKDCQKAEEKDEEEEETIDERSFLLEPSM